MDDGSKDIQQSLDMLHACADQNIDLVIATPHFYGEKESVNRFLERRNTSFIGLNHAIAQEKGLPMILLGSEVSFYDGISRTDEIDRLCAGKSRCLLLEMPFEKWNRRILSEVYSLMLVKRLDVIIAHIERYLPYGNTERELRDLIEMGAIFQINTSSFRKYHSRKCVLNLLKTGDFFVLGTDCHNTSDRRPDFSGAQRAIAAKFGQEKLRKIDALSKSLITKCQ